MKKWLLTLGAMTTVVSPIAAVVACGSDSDDDDTTPAGVDQTPNTNNGGTTTTTAPASDDSIAQIGIVIDPLLQDRDGLKALFSEVGTIKGDFATSEEAVEALIKSVKVDYLFTSGYDSASVDSTIDALSDSELADAKVIIQRNATNVIEFIGNHGMLFEMQGFIMSYINDPSQYQTAPFDISAVTQADIVTKVDLTGAPAPDDTTVQNVDFEFSSSLALANDAIIYGTQYTPPASSEKDVTVVLEVKILGEQATYNVDYDLHFAYSQDEVDAITAMLQGLTVTGPQAPVTGEVTLLDKSDFTLSDPSASVVDVSLKSGASYGSTEAMYNLTVEKDNVQTTIDSPLITFDTPYSQISVGDIANIGEAPLLELMHALSDIVTPGQTSGQNVSPDELAPKANLSRADIDAAIAALTVTQDQKDLLTTFVDAQDDATEVLDSYHLLNFITASAFSQTGLLVAGGLFAMTAAMTPPGTGTNMPEYALGKEVIWSGGTDFKTVAEGIVHNVEINPLGGSVDYATKEITGSSLWAAASMAMGYDATIIYILAYEGWALL